MIEKINESILQPPTLLNREDKLKWLMQTYGNDVIRIAYTYVKQKALAEDIAQDVFIKVYENMDSFRNESSYKSWVIKITINRCKDVLRSWSIRNLFYLNIISDKRVHSSIENQLFPNDEDLLLSEKVMELPVKQREVIILFYYQECSIEEISDLLKTNPNTIKTRLYRARLKLKEILEGE